MSAPCTADRVTVATARRHARDNIVHEVIMTRLVCLMAFTLVAACGPDAVGSEGVLVGGSCAGAGDCDQRCQTGGDFPGGTCTVSCSTDADCPDGTHCIDKEGGICLVACTLPEDCRREYNCEGQSNRGHGGDSLVCIN